MIERTAYTSGGYRMTCDVCQAIVAEHDEFNGVIELARENCAYLDAWWNGVNHVKRWYCANCIQTGLDQRRKEVA